MKKILGIMIIMSILIFCFATISDAESFSFIASPDKTTLKPGEEIELTLKVANINIGNNGINTIEAKLEYDDRIFENVTQEDVKSLNNWSLTYNGEDTVNKGKMLGIILSAGVKEDQEIGTIKLKVKDDFKSSTKTKQTSISLVSVATNNGAQIISESDKSIPIEIEVNVVTTEDTIKDSEKNKANEIKINENTNSDENKITDVNNLIKKGDSTTAEGDVPQTGINDIFCMITIIIPAIAAIAGYVGYKRIKLS